MTTARQDAWTQDEDLMLAEVVLRHIREGSTQLIAFEEVGKNLSRTSAACGFRWNSYVRKQYKPAIEIAKKKRKGEKLDEPSLQLENEKNSKREEVGEDTPSVVEEYSQTGLNSNSGIDLKSVIHYLTELETTSKRNDDLSREIEKVKIENHSLVKKNQALKEKVEELQEQFDLIEEDYKAVIKVMETARKMIVLQEDESNRKFSFQMDKNGNLEKVSK